MRIKTASTIITFVVITLISITLISLWIAVSSFEQRRQAQNRHHKIIIMEYQMSDTVRALSENAKAFVVTKDPRFKQAYDDELAKNGHLSLAYKDLQVLEATPTELHLAKKILLNAQQLNQQERLAMAKVLANHGAEGVAILYGSAYLKDLDNTITSINLLKNLSNQLEQKDVLRLTQQAQRHTVIMLAIMVISIGISIIAMIFFYHRRVAIPLDRITRNLKSLVLKEQPIVFANNKDMQEIAELTHVLDNYHHLYMTLESEKEKLETIKGELQTIIDSATAGVVMLKNRVIQRTNFRADELFGYQHGEMLGHKTRIWYADDETFLRVGEDVMQQMSKREPYIREAQWVRKDGSLLWARISARAIDYNDPAKGLVLIVEDISKDREAADALLKAKLLAEEMARTKADFLANMSHEIRTPMNAIIGFTHLLLKSPLNHQQNDYIQKIQIASQHLLGVINDILDYSKIEAGKITLENSIFDFQDLVDNVLNLINEKAVEKGLKLIVSLDKDIPKLLVGDPLRIAQVLINYANNAVKFTSQGEIEISAKVVKHHDDQYWLRVAVRDTGIGLSQEQMSHLFKSFTQVDTSTTRQYGGTGLGLSIAKRLTEMMGGEVGVESDIDVGSTFWFTIPVTIAEGATVLSAPNTGARLNDEATKTQHYEQAVAADVSTIRGASILLVEDDELNLEVENALLKDAGFLVDVATNGVEAINKVKQKSYDVVLMDVQMPVMDGLTATREIRRLPEGSNLPIIAMTASATQADQENCLAAGMNDHVAKPVVPQYLWRKMLKWVTPSARVTVPTPSVAPSAEETILVHGLGLHTIPGLDTAKGLKNALGKQSLYVSLLKKYVNTQNDFAERMQKALHSHDLATAELIAHTLKSTSAQIGAEDIRALAQQLELAIREKKAFTLLQSASDNIAHELTALVEAISAKIYVIDDQPLPVMDHVDIDVAALKNICEQLALHLKNGDFKSGDYIKTHERELMNALGQKFQPIVQAVNNFDYLTALQLLREAVKPYTIELNV